MLLYRFESQHPAADPDGDAQAGSPVKAPAGASLSMSQQYSKLHGGIDADVESYESLAGRHTGADGRSDISTFCSHLHAPARQCLLDSVSHDERSEVVYAEHPAVITYLWMSAAMYLVLYSATLVAALVLDHYRHIAAATVLVLLNVIASLMMAAQCLGFRARCYVVTESRLLVTGPPPSYCPWPCQSSVAVLQCYNLATVRDAVCTDAPPNSSEPGNVFVPNYHGGREPLFVAAKYASRLPSRIRRLIQAAEAHSVLSSVRRVSEGQRGAGGIDVSRNPVRLPIEVGAGAATEGTTYMPPDINAADDGETSGGRGGAADRPVE
jgi:hypothetical protein